MVELKFLNLYIYSEILKVEFKEHIQEV